MSSRNHSPSSEEPCKHSPRKRQKMDQVTDHDLTVSESLKAGRKELEDEQLRKEYACGITELVDPDHSGFTGIIKKRYTDFLVNEILPSGQVVHLEELRPSKNNKKKEAREAAVPSGQDLQVTPAAKLQAVDVETSGPTESHTTQVPAAPITTPALNQDQTSPTITENGREEQIGPGTTASTLVDTPTHGEQIKNEPAKSIGLSDLSSPEQAAQPPKPLLPHLRVPARSHGVSVANDKTAADTGLSGRKKETVRIRHTSEGWKEVDQEKEKKIAEEKAAKVADPSSDAVLPSTDTTENEAADQSMQTEEQKPKTAPLPSDESQWQAFAGNDVASQPAIIDFKVITEDMAILAEFFGRAFADDIVAFHQRITSNPLKKPKDYGNIVSDKIDRQTRSKAHQAVRRIFGSRIETVTEDGGAIVVKAMPGQSSFYGRTPVDKDNDNQLLSRLHQGRNNHGGGSRGNQSRNYNDRKQAQKRNVWVELGGNYLHFTLCKENKDTMEAISWLAKGLGTKPQAFQFAGTKDRRGVTTQRVSAYRIFADRMAISGRTLRMARIGNYEYKPDPLQLGELCGNEFTITVRNCKFDYEVSFEPQEMIENAKLTLAVATSNLMKYGFINYYGLQRFGTFSTSTDQVGVKLLQGDFEGAVNAILHFNPTALEAAQNPALSKDDKISRDDQARALAINNFKTTGLQYPALNELPKKFSAEMNVVRYLGRPDKAKDFLGALQSIPRNLRLMYVHAYQSLVWNMAASYRWKLFKSTVVEGDLVIVHEFKELGKPGLASEKIDTDGEVVVDPYEDDRALDPDESFVRARALTGEEALSGKYTIFDIVLPTPGFDITYPENEIQSFYKDFMASERGGGLDPYDMRRKWKDVSLSGSYRKLLAKPISDISTEYRVYKDEDEQFVDTDLDRLNKAKRMQMAIKNAPTAPLCDDPAKETENDGPEGNAPPDSPLDSEPGGVSLKGNPNEDNKTAVILKFQLASSQYATMALRELMKYGAYAYKPDFGGGR